MVAAANLARAKYVSPRRRGPSLGSRLRGRTRMGRPVVGLERTARSSRSCLIVRRRSKHFLAATPAKAGAQLGDVADVRCAPLRQLSQLGPGLRRGGGPRWRGRAVGGQTFPKSKPTPVQPRPPQTYAAPPAVPKVRSTHTANARHRSTARSCTRPRDTRRPVETRPPHAA